MATASVILENKTDYNVVIGLYNAPEEIAQQRCVGAKAMITIAVPNPGARVILAWWQATPQGPWSLYPSNEAPFSADANLDPDTTYRVILDTGGIHFGGEAPAS